MKKSITILLVIILMVSCSSSKNDDKKDNESAGKKDNTSIMTKLDEEIIGVWKAVDGTLTSIDTSGNLKKRTEEMIIKDFYEDKYYSINLKLLNGKLTKPFEEDSQRLYVTNGLIVVMSSDSSNENSSIILKNGDESIIEINARSQNYVENGEYILNSVVKMDKKTVNFITYFVDTEAMKNERDLTLFSLNLNDNKISEMDKKTIAYPGKGGVFFTKFETRVQDIFVTQNSIYVANGSVSESISTITTKGTKFGDSDSISDRMKNEYLLEAEKELCSAQLIDTEVNFICKETDNSKGSQLTYDIVEDFDISGKVHLSSINGKLFGLLPTAELDTTTNKAINIKLKVFFIDFKKLKIEMKEVPIDDGYLIDLSKMY